MTYMIFCEALLFIITTQTHFASCIFSETWTEFSSSNTPHTCHDFPKMILSYIVIPHLSQGYSFLVFPWITAFCFWVPHSGTSVIDSSLRFISPCETCLLNSQQWYALKFLAVIYTYTEKCHFKHTPEEPVLPFFRMAL